jgi:dihydrofolate reductase
MTCLSLIAAVARNRVIGLNNALPWHLPEDLKRFRALTTGHHIIMGRKTYESLNRLLPERTTVIVTRNTSYDVPGAVIVHTLEQALEACAGDAEAFVIGGAELYREGLRHAHKMYITEIDAAFKGDVVFPEFDRTQWQETSRECHISEQGLPFAYVSYQRKGAV